ncbi:MAG: TRAP transporter small permease subunit [Reichenbachiella sp.]
MKIIERIMRFGTLLSSLAFVGAILIQIYARFFLETAPSWTEEASRFFFVYAMSFAAGLAMKDNEFVRLDWIYDKLSASHKEIVNVGVSLITLILFLITGVYSTQYIVLGWKESSPSLGWTMGVAFISILLMSVSISFYTIVKLKNKEFE